LCVREFSTIPCVPLLHPSPVAAADLQILVLSAGRSLVKCDMELPLSADAQASVASDAAAGHARFASDFTEVRGVRSSAQRASFCLREE